jgi:hypothetical protein
MTKRPDLGAMALPKIAAAESVPFSAPPAPAAPAAPIYESGLASKSLTIKLDGPLYGALRNHCHAEEMKRGKRVTHQEVMVEALRHLLGLGE